MQLNPTPSGHSALARLSLTLLFAVGAGQIAAAQTTYYVDDDHPSDPFFGFSGTGLPFSNPSEDGSASAPFDDIQKAIDAAVNGDTVLVEPSNHFGFYSLANTPFGSLDFKGKAITVKSTGGAAQTTIDGSQLAGEPGVLFTSGEGPGTVLEGFTIANCDNGAAGSDRGGAVYINFASPTVRDCVFVGNSAYSGGGIYMNGSTSQVVDCRFELNSVVHQGGGIYTSGSSPQIERCDFVSNTAGYGGGLLSRTSSSVTVSVSDCNFVGNNATLGYGGGAAKFDTGSIVLDRCRFLSNAALTYGGGLHINDGAAVSNCTFNTNTSGSDQGGGVSINNSTSLPTNLYNLTVTNNQGGGLYEFSNTVYGFLHNSICWGNGGYEMTSSFSVDYSSVLGGYAFSGAGDGVLDEDPMFKDAWGDDGVRGTLDDDLSLLKQTRCIDAGDTTLLPLGHPMDLAGNPRAADRPKSDIGVTVVGLTVDLGAFEYQSKPDCNRVVNLQSYP